MFLAELNKAGYAKLLEMREWVRQHEESGKQAAWQSCREAVDDEIRQRDLLRSRDLAAW